jgi:hypothetical protein
VIQLTSEEEKEEEVIQSKNAKAGSASPKSEVVNVALESQSMNVEFDGT